MKLLTFRSLLLLAICGYQRYLSPHKGYSCAYRVHTGCASCSAFGYRAVRRYGSASGLIVLRRRLALCGETWRRHHPPAPVNYQAGDCDPGCLDCSPKTAAERAGGCACDALGNWPWSSEKRRRRKEKPLRF